MRRTWLLLALPALALLPPPPAALAQRTPPPASVRAEQFFVQGMTRAYLGDFAEAIELYEQALALRPREGAVYAALAEAYEAMDDLPAALYAAQQAAAASPEEPSVYRILARLQLAVGDAGAAVTSQERLVALAPRDPDALSLLARTQQQLGRLEDALGTYERLLDFLGESPSIRARMLQIHRRLGDTAGTAEALEVLRQTDPLNPALALELAEAYALLGRPLEAVATLEALLEAQPGDLDASLALAELYRQLGDEASAEALTRSLDERPEIPQGDAVARAAALHARAEEDPAAAEAARVLLEELGEDAPPETLLLLGNLRFQAGDYAAAGEALAAALAADPAHPTAWALLGSALLNAGEAAAAADAAEDALLLFPGQYPLLRVAVLAHVEAGRTREGLARAQEALDLLAEETPADATAERALILSHLGILHARTGQSSESETAYNEALSLAPDSPLVLNNYAYGLAVRVERLDEALRMARRAVDRDPENPSFLDTLGWVHYVRGDYAEAAEWLSRAVAAAERAGAPKAILLEHLGDAEAARGRTDEAARHWEAALRSDPSRTHLEQKLEGIR